MKRYPNQYAGPDTGPGRSLKLLEGWGPEDGVVLDVGCGRAPLADHVEDLGLTYVGIDVDSDAVGEVRSRGFEGHRADLGGSSAELKARFEEIVADRRVAAILAIDLLEHLIEPAGVLEALRAVAPEDCALIVSVPNVTHLDIASKLLMGHWDLTEFGLLDDTHLRFYSERLFEELFSATGWEENERDDITTPAGDQNFPPDSPFVNLEAPVRRALHSLSSRSHPSFETYQFVRRFVPSKSAPAGHSWPVRREPADDRPFASVLVHADGDRSSAKQALADLDAQSSRDFETILLDEGETWNTGLAKARGRYACFLDATARVSTRWIETFAAAEPKGLVLVAEAVSVASRRIGEMSADDLVPAGKPFALSRGDLLHPNRPKPAILSAYAIPLAAVRTAGLLFEPQYGEAAPAVFVATAVHLSGLVELAAPTVVVPNDVRRNADADLDTVAAALDNEALVLPPGSASKLVELQKFRWRRTLPRRAIKKVLARRRSA